MGGRNYIRGVRPKSGHSRTHSHTNTHNECTRRKLIRVTSTYSVYTPRRRVCRYDSGGCSAVVVDFQKPPSSMALHQVNFAGLIGNYCSETMGYTFIPPDLRPSHPWVINGCMF